MLGVKINFRKGVNGRDRAYELFRFECVREIVSSSLTNDVLKEGEMTVLDKVKMQTHACLPRKICK